MIELPAIVTAARAALRAGDRREVATIVEAEILRRAPLLDPAGVEQVRTRALADLVGLGPLEPWLADPAVSEVMVNAAAEIWIDRTGRPERVGRLALGQLEAALERIISPLGLRLDRTNPIVDARLPDGSRLCAVAPPVAPDGLCCSIRRFRVRRLDWNDLGEREPIALLHELVERRCNVVVSGATSSGKTTVLNAMATLIGLGERIVTIEDTLELQLDTDHVVRLEARTRPAEGLEPIGVRELVRTALRLRPDRLVVGEVRGPEALDMVQALNTGHDGSLTTCHANGPLDALRRLEAMVLMAAPSWPIGVVREQVHGSVDVIVHLARRADGARRLVAIAEVSPPERATNGERIALLADSQRRLGTLSRGRA